MTVLSTRITLPLSSFSWRALESSTSLMSSQVEARIALIVLCRTDFFGLHPHGSRANARNEAKILQVESQFLVAELAMLLEQRAAQHRLRRQALAAGLVDPVPARRSAATSPVR